MKAVYTYEVTGDHKYTGFYMAEDDHQLGAGETFDTTESLYSTPDHPITRDTINHKWISMTAEEWQDWLKSQPTDRPTLTADQRTINMLTQQVAVLSAKVSKLTTSITQKGAEQ